MDHCIPFISVTGCFQTLNEGGIEGMHYCIVRFDKMWSGEVPLSAARV
jgi:hypothetical protein